MAHHALTCNDFRMTAAFAPCDEDDIPLSRIDIVVVQIEDLVYAILSQRRDVDDRTDGANQAAIQDDILLATDLRTEKAGSAYTAWDGSRVGSRVRSSNQAALLMRGERWRVSLTYALEQVEQVLASLAADLLCVELGARRHVGRSRTLARRVEGSL